MRRGAVLLRLEKSTAMRTEVSASAQLQRARMASLRLAFLGLAALSISPAGTKHVLIPISRQAGSYKLQTE